MEQICVDQKIPVLGSYDIIVAGGGVAGVAAALSGVRRGKSVLLLEKSVILGGLATLGLINYFVPMCNGRGKQIIFGMGEELLRACGDFGYDTIPEAWRKGEPEGADVQQRYVCRYSPYIFALVLTQMVLDAGVELRYDSVVTRAVMEGTTCRGVVVQGKEGAAFYRAKMIVDATGDGDVLRSAGVPTVAGQNYFTYMGKGISLASCEAAVQTGDIRQAYERISGGNINLYGQHQPADIPLFSGLSAQDVTDYLVRNQQVLLEKIKSQPRFSRDIAMLPMMPQLRTPCHIDGDDTLVQEDAYRHFEDSVCAINDFDHRDYLYEVPLRCLVKAGYPNLITAGRSASASGYGWDILRVIPPAILTGQAAGEACALAIETETQIDRVPIRTLQQRLEQAHVMIHFPDDLVPQAAHTADQSDQNVPVQADDEHF